MTKEFKGALSFMSPINEERSAGCTRIADNVKSEISVTIEESGNGHFDWEVPRLNRMESGGLWFDGNELVDYDGVMCLPAQLIEYLEQQGYNMEWAK